MTEHLFVYGTLRRASAHPMARYLEEHSTWLGRAPLPGRLYDLGAFPGLLPAASPMDWVQGEVVALKTPISTLDTLDRYEGCGPGVAEPWQYERRSAQAVFADGAELTVWVYYYLLPVQESNRIPTGQYPL